MDEKHKLRAQLRMARRQHVAGLAASTRALVFMRPPGMVATLAGEGAVVGLYHATPDEAPTRGYAKWFAENGRTIALPRFAERGAPMCFCQWRNPFDDESLEKGPYGALQPAANAPEVTPSLVFVPLVGFTATGERLGQGGGHYDRWLAANPEAVPLGLAWDCQLLGKLPTEPHDQPLKAIITPTRAYGGLD